MDFYLKKFLSSWQIEAMPSLIRNIFENKNIPILNIKNRFIGDYIDFITLDEVIYPIMKGLDSYNRPFIVIKMMIEGTLIMQTFFRRYIDGYQWQGCGHATQNLLVETSGGMKEDQIQLISDIINERNIKIKMEHRPTNSYIRLLFLGKYYPKINEKEGYIRLYSEKEYNACIIIQRAWHECRYNPKYKMCGDILMKNIESIYQERERAFIKDI